MMGRFSAGLCTLCVVACGSHTPGKAVDFTVGSSNDPVVKAALTSGTTTSTLNITIQNSSTHSYGEGVLTLSPIFTAGQAPSAAVSSFVKAGSKDTSSTFIQNLGLTLNVNVFKVPAVTKGTSRSVAVVVPTGTQLYYFARVSSSDADFVAMGPLPLSSTLSRYSAKKSPITMTSSTGNGGGSVVDPSACTGPAAMTQTVTLFDDEMGLAAYDPQWPMSAGYDGEFNGEWYTDGVSARVLNNGTGLPLGAVTGFLKFLSICPTLGATISLEADIDTAQYTATSSDTTLHIYYFDAANNVLKIDYGYPVQKGSLRRLGLYDSLVPTTARRVALVPMARFEAAEKSTVFYQNLKAMYEPAGAVKVTALASDSFATYDATSKQPTGWAEFNGDWYVIPANSFATLWNPKWGGDQSNPPPVDTGMTKTYSLGAVQAGDALTVTLFAATTFTDATSFVRVRLLFNNGIEIASDRTGGSTYNEVQMRRVAIPLGATAVTVIVNAFLGANETSSLYVDDLRVSSSR